MLIRVLVLLVHWELSFAVCIGQPGVLAPSSGLSLGPAREVAANGSVVPLKSVAPQEALFDGQSRSIPCHDFHWGLAGNASLSCVDPDSEVDTLGCVRIGCPWHRLSATPLGENFYSAPDRDLSVSGETAGAPQKWTAPVLAWDGALYAAPRAADNVLRVSHSTSGGASVEVIQPTMSLSGSFAKYGSAVLGSDGFVYCIPYSASQVMRIDPFLVAAGGGSSALELFGDVGTTGYKWLHGVMSQTSSIYAVPAGASTVLVIDTASLNVSELAIGATLPASFENFVHSVLSPQGDIFGIPADSTFVLWIRPSTQAVSTLGNFSSDTLKWGSGILGLDGIIYGIPGAATVILRIDPATDPPTLDETLGDGLFDATTQKWSAAILGPDGRIFGVPHGASQVLLIDPALSSVFLVGPVWGGGLYKWQGGILAIDHSIYMMPYDNERVLRVIPNSTGADVVEEVLDGFTLPGEQKYSGVAMVPSGALFAFPAYAAEVLSMVPAVDLCLAGPQFQESVCTLGQSCTVELTPTPDWPTNLSNGILWVSPAGSLCQEQLNLEVIGFTNPQTEPTQTGQGEQVTHSFGTGLSGNVSTQSLLCWKFHASSLDIIELGQFQLLGPYQNHQVICNLGEPCLVILNGVGLDNSSWVLAAAANGSCNVSNETLADFQGFANPVKYDGSPGESASFGLGEAINGTAGSYEICWSSSTLTSPSLDLFVTHVGSLVVNGPFLATSIDLSCWVQFECSLVVAGVGLSAQNQLTIGQLDCNSTMQLAMIDGFSNPVTSTNGTTYVIGAALAAYRDRLVLCWHATSTATGIPLGTLMVYGPVNGGLHITCRLNDTCSISLANETIIGYIDDGFSLQNRLQLEKQDSCTGIPASLWGNLSQPVVPSATLVANFSSLFFDLFAPTANNVTAADEVLGAYSLCLSLGDGPFAMKLGLLLIEDVFCAAPEGIVQALEPACLSSTTGLSASSLRHGESCITQCDAESTESLNSLDCVYGELQPASFECFRSCTTAPVVNNGLSHESCAGLLHGAVCDLQCAANTVASGYLLCNFGFFIHKALLPGEFLFGVPRCYQSCDATTVCGAAYALLPHAESCQVVCPSGSRPDTSTVSCRDGTLDPPSPECLAGCTSGPDVQNATNTNECGSVVSGTACSIRCQAGYAKTGDPVCTRGTWSIERCLAPCVPPAVANTTDGWSSCNGIIDGGVVPHSVPCTPACKTGFLPEVPGGLGELSCFDGQLSPSSFLCRAPCSQAPSVAFADQTLLAACAGTLHNQSCEVSCLGGRIKTGDLACQDGVFSSASCMQLCTSPPIVANALPVSGCTARPNGATCSIQCAEGFSSPPNLSAAVCTDGAWSEVRCDKACAAPADVEQAAEPSCQEGLTVYSGGACTPSCQEGLQPNEIQLQCFQGVLSPPVFSCGRECGEVGFIEHAVPEALVRCVGMQYKKVCPLSCSAGFRPSADLFCGQLGWQQYLPSDPTAPLAPLPSCERVTCSLPLPSVPGSDQAAVASGRLCVTAIAGDNCSDVQCPLGSVLSGHFQCGDSGLWRPVPAPGTSEVKCAEQLCPENSPAPIQGESTFCLERAIGSTCPLTCPNGYRSTSGYICGSDSQWVPLPGPAPACSPGTCDTLPSLGNALFSEACLGLPSGGTCQGECIPPWQPLGQYRCEAERWVEVPLCLPPEMSANASLPTVPAVTFSALLEPSSDLQDFYSLDEWALLSEGPMEQSVRRLVTETAPATSPATVRVIGKRAEEASSGQARRVQSVAELKPPAWLVEFHLLIAPNPVAAAGQQVMAALRQLQPGQMAEGFVQALPAVARPEVLRLTAAAPQQVSLPTPAAEALAQPDGLVLTTTTTTTTQPVWTPATQPSEGSNQSGSGDANLADDTGFDARWILLIISIPLAFALAIFVSRSLRRYFTASHETVTEADKVDFQYVLREERLSDDAAGDVSLNQVKGHERRQTMRAQREDLHAAMTTGILEAAAAEVEAETEQPEDEERTYDLAKLGDQKQMPTIGLGLETLQNPERRQTQAPDCMVDVRSLRQGTGEMMVRSQTNLTKREKRSIFKKALWACWAEVWYSFLEAFPLLNKCCRCCCCRCCTRPPQAKSSRDEEEGDELSMSESSERTPEVIHRPRRASRISLSSCDAAEAVADGLERGLSPEQVYAIRDFWNFKGADELIEDLEGKIPYHVALRGEKADPSLASRYYASERGGNVVSEKIAEVRLHGEEERSEVHTLKLHPPSRKMIQAREDESTPQDEDVSVHEYEEDEERSEEVEIHENSGGEESNESDEEASSTDSSVKEESKDHHVLIAASAMETNYSVHRMEVVEIPELDADNVRAAVARAKVSAHYMQSARIQGKADDKSPKEMNAPDEG